jgi:uncharacterized membrane protein YebE (DUF533 family)
MGTLSGKFPEMDAAAATLAGLLCIGGIGGLAYTNLQRQIHTSNKNYISTPNN